MVATSAAARPRAARSRCRWDRRWCRRALPARGKSGAVALAEAHDLVLDRRAIARAAALDLARNTSATGARLVADERVGRRRRAGDAAGICGCRRSARSGTRTARAARRRAASPAPPSRWSAVEPRRRPGLEPAERKPRRSQGRATARSRRLPDAAGRDLCSPIWIRPRRNVPVVSTTAPAPSSRPSASVTPATRPAIDDQIVGLGFDHVQICSVADRLPASPRVELAVGLGARARGPPGPCGG